MTVQVHDEPDQRTQDQAVCRALRARGCQVIVILYDQDLGDQIACYPEVFGKGGE